MDSGPDAWATELLMEQFGPRRLPPPAPPHPVEQALAARKGAPPAEPRRRGHLVLHEGGAEPGVAA